MISDFSGSLIGLTSLSWTKVRNTETVTADRTASHTGNGTRRRTNRQTNRTATAATAIAMAALHRDDTCHAVPANVAIGVPLSSLT